MYFISLIQSIPHLPILIVTVVTILVLEYVLYRYRKDIAEKYRSKKSGILSSEEAERESLRYFSNLHTVSIVRMAYFFVLLMVVITLYDIRAFSFFAVAFGAILIALRDVIISFLAYPHVVLSYDIGDDIRISGVLGEVVRVRLLSTQLAGKDERGDYNGRLQIIPNAKFLIEAIEKLEIKNANQRMVTLSALYKKEEYKQAFSLWLIALKTELDTLLPKKSLKDVGNFKSFAGMRYKLHYDYNEDGDVRVDISFVSSTKTALNKKEEIISFIEGTKREEITKETRHK